MLPRHHAAIAVALCAGLIGLGLGLHQVYALPAYAAANTLRAVLGLAFVVSGLLGVVGDARGFLGIRLTAIASIALEVSVVIHTAVFYWSPQTGSWVTNEPEVVASEFRSMAPVLLAGIAVNLVLASLAWPVRKRPSLA